jgi:hypothetical protein
LPRNAEFRIQNSELRIKKLRRGLFLNSSF